MPRDHVTTVSSARIGIVGCGAISHTHAAAAAHSGGAARLVACCDVDRSRAEAWAARYEVEGAYGELAAMLDAEQLGGVLLATWPNLHRTQIEECLRHGARHILCEKSLAVSGSEAAEIHALATSSGVIYGLTQGGPAGASETMIFRVWRVAFSDLDLGYAATIALLMAAMILCVTVLFVVGLSRQSTTY